MDDLRDQTAVVTGGSRGFGRGIVEALAGAGMRVVAVARDPGALAALAREVKGRVETVAADATDPVTAARVIDRERPRVLVLNAGATGPHRPTRLQTWETFSVFWQTDVRSAFLWVREALALPLERGSTIFIGSSTAAWSSQPLIAGYATAKAALTKIRVRMGESPRTGVTRKVPWRTVHHITRRPAPPPSGRRAKQRQPRRKRLGCFRRGCHSAQG